MSWREFFYWPLEVVRTIYNKVIRWIRCLFCKLFDVKECQCGDKK